MKNLKILWMKVVVCLTLAAWGSQAWGGHPFFDGLAMTEASLLAAVQEGRADADLMRSPNFSAEAASELRGRTGIPNKQILANKLRDALLARHALLLAASEGESTQQPNFSAALAASGGKQASGKQAAVPLPARSAEPEPALAGFPGAQAPAGQGFQVIPCAQQGANAFCGYFALRNALLFIRNQPDAEYAGQAPAAVQVEAWRRELGVVLANPPYNPQLAGGLPTNLKSDELEALLRVIVAEQDATNRIWVVDSMTQLEQISNFTVFSRDFAAALNNNQRVAIVLNLGDQIGERDGAGFLHWITLGIQRAPDAQLVVRIFDSAAGAQQVYARPVELARAFAARVQACSEARLTGLGELMADMASVRNILVEGNAGEVGEPLGRIERFATRGFVGHLFGQAIRDDGADAPAFYRPIVTRTQVIPGGITFEALVQRWRADGGPVRWLERAVERAAVLGAAAPPRQPEDRGQRGEAGSSGMALEEREFRDILAALWEEPGKSRVNTEKYGGAFPMTSPDRAQVNWDWRGWADLGDYGRRYGMWIFDGETDPRQQSGESASFNPLSSLMREWYQKQPGGQVPPQEVESSMALQRLRTNLLPLPVALGKAGLLAPGELERLRNATFADNSFAWAWTEADEHGKRAQLRDYIDQICAALLPGAKAWFAAEQGTFLKPHVWQASSRSEQLAQLEAAVATLSSLPQKAEHVAGQDAKAPEVADDDEQDGQEQDDGDYLQQVLADIKAHPLPPAMEKARSRLASMTDNDWQVIYDYLYRDSAIRPQCVHILGQQAAGVLAKKAEQLTPKPESPRKNLPLFAPDWGEVYRVLYRRDQDQCMRDLGGDQGVVGQLFTIWRTTLEQDHCAVNGEPWGQLTPQIIKRCGRGHWACFNCARGEGKVCQRQDCKLPLGGNADGQPWLKLRQRLGLEQSAGVVAEDGDICLICQLSDDEQAEKWIEMPCCRAMIHDGCYRDYARSTEAVVYRLDVSGTGERTLFITQQRPKCPNCQSERALPRLDLSPREIDEAWVNALKAFRQDVTTQESFEELRRALLHGLAQEFNQRSSFPDFASENTTETHRVLARALRAQWEAVCRRGEAQYFVALGRLGGVQAGAPLAAIAVAPLMGEDEQLQRALMDAAAAALAAPQAPNLDQMNEEALVNYYFDHYDQLGNEAADEFIGMNEEGKRAHLRELRRLQLAAP